MLKVGVSAGLGRVLTGPKIFARRRMGDRRAGGFLIALILWCAFGAVLLPVLW
jgi:hypothetical protein